LSVTPNVKIPASKEVLLTGVYWQTTYTQPSDDVDTDEDESKGNLEEIPASDKNIYIMWGLFEDLILNEQFGFGRDKKDVILQGIIKTSDENVKRKKAKDAEAKKIEEERLAKYYRKIIAAAELKKKIADRNAMVDAKAKRDAEKMAERRKMAQDLAADKARRLREYEKGKAINVASIALSLLDEFNKGPKDPNIIKSITEDGIVRTLHCNPGPCTPGSVILHGNISGLDMGVPVNAFAKQLKVHMADRKPEANINVNEDLELIDFLTAFNDVEVMNESEAESDEPNDINLTRALSIPKGQVEENKQAHIDSLHDNDVNPLQHGCWW
jgi:hypothetical protein